MTYKTFYCYLNEGRPRLLECEPDNFENLPFSNKINGPNSVVAEMTFKTNLKIKEWQAEKR